MKFRHLLLVVVLVASLAAAEAGHRLRSRKESRSSRGSPHHRSKRTLGNIINWKLNLLQQIFGGITGLFGGGGGNKKRPRPGYGAPGRRPNRPNRPRPGGPRPGYGPPQRPQRPQRPSYGGGRPQSNGGGSFGPSNAIYMLPAPNLATAAPQTIGGAGRPQSPPAAQDGYGAPQGPVIAAAAPVQNTDSYGAPAADPIVQDGYGAPAAAPISSQNPVDSYGAPQSPALAAAPAPAQNTDSYGAPAASPIEAVPYNPQWTPISAPGGLGRAPARRPITTSTAEQYGAPQPITDIDLPEQPSVVAVPDTKSQVDVYGSPLAPVGTSAPVPAAVLQADAPTSFDAAPFFIPSDDYDEYDASDIPPDQARQQQDDDLDTYGAPPAPVVEAVAPAVVVAADEYDDYDPSDIPPDQAKPDEDLDTYGAPEAGGEDAEGGSGEAAGEVDLRSGKKLDVEEVDDVSNAIDAVEEVSLVPQQPATEVPILFTTRATDDVEETKLPKFVSLDEFIKLQNRGEEISSVTDIAITPTLAPLIVDITGKTGPDEDITEIVEVLERDREQRLIPEDVRLDDPLNIIPDDYYNYEDEDVAVVEEERAEERPVFSDLRSEVQFTTGSADPVPTTYSPPIDTLNLGTTGAANLLLPEHDYALEEDLEELEEAVNEIDDDYYSDDEEDRGGDGEEFDVVLNNVNFPIIIEETNTERVNDPVILLVGTPEEKDGVATTTRRQQAPTTRRPRPPPTTRPSSVILDDTSFTFTPLETTQVTTELPLFDTQPPEKEQVKRRAKSRSSLADRYNNWFGRPNDWSHRIQRLQGARIRFKNGNEFGRAARRNGGN